MINKNRQGKVNHKRVQRIMHELGIIGIQGKNSKYHSYKGDNGIEKSNLLLEKVVDEEKHRTTFIRHFEKQDQIKSGLLIFQSLSIKMVSFIYHLLCICMTVL